MIYTELNLSNGDVVDESMFKHIDDSFLNISKNTINDDYSIHISFDDVVACITNLVNNTYNSLYEEPFFGWLKTLHDAYGAKFSLYIYDLTKFANVPVKYKQEFFDARHWLKFGLHSKSSGHNYASDTYDNAKKDWNSLVTNVLRITGTHQSIDRCPRLHNFAGNVEVVKGMKEATCGVIGFLGSDDSRTSYHLSDTQNTVLNNNLTFLDQSNGLIIFKTNYRGEFLSSVDGMYEKMQTFLSDTTKVNCFRPFIWFTHEPYVYKNSVLTDYSKNVEDVCKFAFDHNICFTYPQNKIGINPQWFVKVD